MIVVLGKVVPTEIGAMVVVVLAILALVIVARFCRGLIAIEIVVQFVVGVNNVAAVWHRKLPLSTGDRLSGLRCIYLHIVTLMRALHPCTGCCKCD